MDPQTLRLWQSDDHISVSSLTAVLADSINFSSVRNLQTDRLMCDSCAFVRSRSVQFIWSVANVHTRDARWRWRWRFIVIACFSSAVLFLTNLWMNIHVKKKNPRNNNNSWMARLRHLNDLTHVTFISTHLSYFEACESKNALQILGWFIRLIPRFWCYH